MPQPPILKILEIFASLQGEGLRQGEPTLFVRLSGCNLRCSFCDTSFAWEGGEDMRTDEILAHIDRLHADWPARWVCLTGGEPLLQDMEELCHKLKDRGFQVQVETNATTAPQFPVDWYTVSPKPPDYSVHPDLRPIARELKLVVSQELTLEILSRIIDTLPDKVPLVLQPESNQDWAINKARYLLGSILKAGKTNARISIQLHKILDIP